jgi:hypothetical protein
MKKGNIANQREHLILLLANFHRRNKKTEDPTEAHHNAVVCFTFLSVI